MMLDALSESRKYMKKLFLTVAIAGLTVGSAQAQIKTIPHYRKSHGATLVCQEIWGANYDPCDHGANHSVKDRDNAARALFAGLRQTDWRITHQAFTASRPELPESRLSVNVAMKRRSSQKTPRAANYDRPRGAMEKA
jgi:hypothetical protein